MNESDFRNIQLIRDYLDLFNKSIHESMDGWDGKERRKADFDLFQTVTTLMAEYEPRLFAVCQELVDKNTVIPIQLRTLINVLADVDTNQYAGYEDEVVKWATLYNRVAYWLRFLDETFPNYNWGDMQMNRWFGHHRTTTSSTNPNTGNPFVARLLASEWFQKAIESEYIPKGHTRPPIPWNGTIKELAISLSESGLLSNPRMDNLTEKTNKWKNANGVFEIDGKPVTNTDLKKGYQR